MAGCFWSDASVFAANSEAGGNAIMFSMTQYALKLLVGKTFTSPVELNDWLWPQVWEYGKKISANPKLRATYALNALVAVDNAVWVLFARENGLKSFDEMIPVAYKPALSSRHAKCAFIPLFSYKVPVAEIKEAVIGCGRISTEFEVPGVLNRPDIARIVAVCDLDMKRARLTAERVEREYADGTKIRIYKDYKEVCAQGDVDAVMICLPDFWHALVATTAICSRKAVWLQKPFANGKFSLNANLAEYGLNFDQGMGGIRDGSFDTVRSA